MDALEHLTDAIRQALPGPPSGFKPIMQELFGGRYQRRHDEPTA